VTWNEEMSVKTHEYFALLEENKSLKQRVAMLEELIRNIHSIEAVAARESSR
jgi:hypothetical protein